MAKKRYIKDSRGMTVSVTTDTLGLEKPLLNENYDIDVHNRNMDKIDEDLKPIDDSYIIELFQHDGDTTSPKDYYTKEEIGNLSQLQTSDKSNLVNAVNEVFQSANNGKELIASAIGEPLSSDDTFSAMSNDINGLLSQFKTNMMNSGVTVENGDKFKQLIDKIKGLTEGEGNKGIKFAEGKISTLTIPYLEWHGFPLDANIDFVPTYLFVIFPTTFRLSSNNYPPCAGVLDCLTYNSKDNSRYIPLSSTAISTYFDIPTMTLYCNNGTGSEKTFYDVTWYAIGVGEEDTTLRDSLASILQEEGVEVTENDDMASLITKTDEEFADQKQQLVNKLTSEGANVSTNNTFEELIGNIALGKKWASGSFVVGGKHNIPLNFTPSIVSITYHVDSWYFGTWFLNANTKGDFTKESFVCYQRANDTYVRTVTDDGTISIISNGFTTNKILCSKYPETMAYWFAIE